MEITKFVLEGRDEAKLFGDSSAYRTRLSNRIHTLRKKLGITTKPRAKYSNKPVTAEDISQSHDYIHLLLLTSERAWAHAMSMKEMHTVDTKGITGSTRSHIVSRLHKATIYANDLFRLLSDKSTTNANDVDILEARAYAAALAGAMEFEKQSWEACVKRYAEARIIYTALSKVTKADIFKDLLTDPVDPSIRYGAYKMGLPRTLAISAIARKNFPSEDQELTSQVEKLDPDCLKDEGTISEVESLESDGSIKTIVWRSRTVVLEDAAIATALGSVKEATTKLSNTLSSSSPKDRGFAYDDILIASQEVVDATKHAIDELASEGVGQGDKRMQSLLVTRTAVSYDMIGWRIGRNRVMVGQQDGIIDYVQSFPAEKGRRSTKDEPIGRKLAKLREKVVLYDAILQSIESISELPGVAADSSLQEELDAKYSYFQALKCLIIARSHAILSNPKNALALLNRAAEKCAAAHSKLSSSMDTTTKDSPPNLTVSPSQTENFLAYLQCELQRYRALVEISHLTSTTPKPGDENVQQAPLIERLHEYPADGVVDLKNLVNYPPKLEVVPVKPLFFDSAWNYIDYPGRTTEKAAGKTAVEEEAKETEPEEPQEQHQQQKKGWFGFGR
ncbi:putative signal recognition protein [Botrytis fragariae]|uniref:Signal recognition particle subunit SRP68 n=1 Tax=Botrytis fragariae TaxID=1964551 RepID=A0A8H6AW43_9HELO|nr:putative signal recognition protein [Botrytis fragariae]KAF5874657.1 putative signal recognition protein [Botrytis fragariae]